MSDSTPSSKTDLGCVVFLGDKGSGKTHAFNSFTTGFSPLSPPSPQQSPSAPSRRSYICTNNHSVSFPIKLFDIPGPSESPRSTASFLTQQPPNLVVLNIICSDFDKQLENLPCWVELIKTLKTYPFIIVLLNACDSLLSDPLPTAQQDHAGTDLGRDQFCETNVEFVDKLEECISRIKATLLPVYPPGMIPIIIPTSAKCFRGFKYDTLVTKSDSIKSTSSALLQMRSLDELITAFFFYIITHPSPAWTLINEDCNEEMMEPDSEFYCNIAQFMLLGEIESIKIPKGYQNVWFPPNYKFHD